MKIETTNGETVLVEDSFPIRDDSGVWQKIVNGRTVFCSKEEGCLKCGIFVDHECQIGKEIDYEHNK